MHPSELKNRALVAANAAELSGFTFTARALLAIAKSCAEEVAVNVLQDAAADPRWSARRPGNSGVAQSEGALV
jgi:hypothetical protein